MLPHIVPSLLLLGLAVLIIRAAASDIRSRTISNRLNAAIALSAPAYWFSIGLSPWPDMAIQLGVASGVLVVFVGLFALGMMGGGDVKMLAALALWLPVTQLPGFLILMALLGGGVTIATVIHHRVTRRIGQPEIPYGVAIALAALWVIGEPYLNQSA